MAVRRAAVRPGDEHGGDHHEQLRLQLPRGQHRPGPRHQVPAGVLRGQAVVGQEEQCQGGYPPVTENMLLMNQNLSSPLKSNVYSNAMHLSYRKAYDFYEFCNTQRDLFTLQKWWMD